MARFVLHKDAYECLKNLYQGQDMDAGEAERLLESSAIVTEKEEGTKELDEEKLSVLRSCFEAKACMEVKKTSMKKEEEFYYYLINDRIVLLHTMEEECRFMTLPAIKYAIGSVADLFWDEVSEKEDTEDELFLEEQLDEANYEAMLQSILSEKWEEDLDMKNGMELTFNCIGKNEKTDLFTVVRISDGVARYYSQEFGKITYGKSSRGKLTNRICDWMLYKHRELISKMIQEV